MPDHYHFLLRQNRKDGIRLFISNFQNSFAKYFNNKNGRDGSVFKNPFQAKWIDNDKILIHISRYIHLNPVTSYLIEIDKLSTYPWTSYPFYLKKIRGNLVNTEFLLKMFGDPNKYKKFVEDRADYQRKLHLIKKAII